MNNNILGHLFELAKEVKPVANARIMACVTYKDKIIGMGQNSKKSHPLAKLLQDNKEKIYLHAEMAAILQAKYFMEDLRDCDIYIVRAKMDHGKFIPGSSKPCDACMKLIAKENIRSLYYGF